MNPPAARQTSVAGPILALLVTVVAVVLVEVRAPPLLVAPSGLLLVLVLPGYVWVHAFYTGDPQPLVRPALIVASSLGITMVVGLIIDLTLNGITRINWCVGLQTAVLLGVVASVVRVALVLRTQSPAASRLDGRQRRAGGSVRLARRPIRLGRLAVGAGELVSLVLLVVAAGWISVVSEAHWEAREHFTALSIAAVGDQTPTLRVLNHEGVAITYTVTATLLRRQVLRERLRVDAGQTRILRLSQISPSLRPGKLLVTLDRPGSRSPYREVWLRSRYGSWL